MGVFLIVRRIGGAVQIPVKRSQLDRDAAFSFSCNRCLRCCRDKKIQINPYESARLAKNLDLTTTEFLHRYTTDNGAFLKFKQNGDCRFLGPEGCLVHPDRPLVCRLYPLSRHVNDKEAEWFSELQRHEDCTGRSLDSGRIEGYLQEQEATPYMYAADCYLEMLLEMMASLEQGQQDDKADEKNDLHTPAGYILQLDMNWMDMDAVVAAYCQDHQQPFPDDVDEKMRLHIKTMKLLIT